MLKLGGTLGWRAALVVLLCAPGCGLVLDLDPPDDAGVARDGGARDAGTRDGGASCGDGVVQPELGEECDETSSTCMDCRRVCDCPAIERPCLDHIDCIDGACVPQLLADGTECVRDDARTGMCEGGLCVPDRCGDGSLDPSEECDDGNTTRGDGCEVDCLFSCHGDVDCDDRDMCNGRESCGAVTEMGRKCGPGQPLDVASCQVCDSDSGPYLPDDDDDTFPADRGQPCDPGPFDCNDADPRVFPGATEVCNHADDDCDERIDENFEVVTCARDADGDGYPGDRTGTILESCTACREGTVPVRASASDALLVDCWDVADSFGPLVHPGQTDFFAEPYCVAGDPGCTLPFDYDCDGAEEQRDMNVGPRCDLLSIAGCRGDGWIESVPPCGAHGTYGNCEPFLILVCSPHHEDRQQVCR